MLSYEATRIIEGPPPPIKRGTHGLSELVNLLAGIEINTGQEFELPDQKQWQAFQRTLTARLKTLKNYYPERKFTTRKTVDENDRFIVTLYRLEDEA